MRGSRFWSVLFGNMFAAVGLIATVAGLYDLLFPDTLPERSALTAGGLAAVVVAFGVFRAWPRPVQQSYTTPRLTIRVVRGDLLAQPGHLIISMNDTFDTDTAAGIIATSSVQAQFLQRLYGGDLARLDLDLAQALSGVVPVEVVTKVGKATRYEIGTVATLRAGRRRFFCFALSSMNEHNEARATLDGVWVSLSQLWKAACTHANGEPVAMAVIGGGQSRLSQSLSAADAIRLQVLSFWLACREERICEEVRIVVRPEVYDGLDRRELQAFLTSLAPS